VLTQGPGWFLWLSRIFLASEIRIIEKATRSFLILEL
jgi:hypothetical protein